jgi:hypothetical protein
MSTIHTSEHEAILDDLPALLTGELTPAREREVADHLDGCDACRRELAVVARASAWLQDAARLNVAPEMLPDGSAEPVTLPPLKLPRHSWIPGQRAGRTGASRTRVLAAAASVVLLVAAVLGGVALGRASDEPADSTVVLSPVPGGVPVVGVVGQARMSADGGMNLKVNGLPTPQGRDYYEVWLFDPPSGRMLAVGVLPPDGKGSYTLPASADRGYSAVEISLEPDDGDPEHSKLSVLRGPLA